MNEHLKPWRALSVDEVAQLFSGATFPWWIAGGYAIELAAGRAIRHHGDVDILLLREDQLQARAWLQSWDCWVADPPGVLRYWPPGEVLGESVHDVWCRRTPEHAWCLQIMLDGSVDGDWISRRDPRIRLPLENIGRKTAAGIPFLAPKVQLFYKAKRIRDKDQMDFDAVMDCALGLDHFWLGSAIAAVYGPGHRWLKHLARACPEVGHAAEFLSRFGS